MSDANDNRSSANAAKGILPPAVSAWWGRFTVSVKGLPRGAKIALCVTGVAALALIAYFASAPMMVDYTVLYTELDSEDAGAVVEKLKARQVDYRLSGDGTTIEVPKTMVHELRLAMATEGLPRGGQVGFESFENMRLGATEFEQQVTYRRAMEGELARTIGTVRDIQSARVHLVLPKKSVFSAQSEPATASVVVRLRSGRTLAADEVNGIVHLVASAVQGLEADRVTLVTTDGRMLHRPRPTSSEGAEGEDLAQLDEDPHGETRAYESLLEDRTRTMLERVLGPGHVDVRIRAEIDRAKVERKSDQYNPKNAALRSESESEERTSGSLSPDDTVAGVPGAESNLPAEEEGAEAEDEAVAGGTSSSTIRRSHTRNFEIDHVQERRVALVHDVRRLAVAVVIDGVPVTADGQTTVEPRSKEELQKLALLVKSAVGFDDKRGDVVTVESVPFYAEPIDAPEVAAEVIPIPEKFRKWVPLAKYGAIGLAVLVALLVLRRKLKKRDAKRRIAEQLKELPPAEALAALAAASDAPVEADYRLESQRRALEDPATAALVLRHWLGTGAHDRREEAA
jgi:flagellar M-ring protein FliF